MVILGKNKIPHFEITLVFPTGATFRIAGIAVSRPAVVKNFRARSARSFADIPEIIRCRINAFRRNADFLVPQPVCFFVFRMNGHRQPLRIEPDPAAVGQKLPRPGDRLFLEIVADRKIAEHFEKRMVTARLADVFDVVGAQAFLHVGDTRVVRLDPAVEIRLERRHPGVDPEQRRIVVRDERCARFNPVSFRREKVEPFVSDFACLHRAFASASCG